MKACLLARKRLENKAQFSGVEVTNILIYLVQDRFFKDFKKVIGFTQGFILKTVILQISDRNGEVLYTYFGKYPNLTTRQ